MDEEDPEPRPFGIAARLALIVFGMSSIAAAFFVGFIILVFLGGGHGNPFGPAIWSEWLFRLALLSIPVLIIFLGFLAIACSDRHGLGRMALAVALIPVFLLIAGAASAWSASVQTGPTLEDPCFDLPPNVCAVGPAPRR